jgi:hypothetical protein
MPRFVWVIALLVAVVLAALGVFGIVRYHDSPGGVIFHAFVLLCAGYLGLTAVRRGSRSG